MGRVGGSPDFFIAGIQPPVADVLHGAGREDHGVLRYQPDAGTDLRRIGRPDIDAVQQHAAVARVVEPEEKLEDRRLAGAARPESATVSPGETERLKSSSAASSGREG